MEIILTQNSYKLLPETFSLRSLVPRNVTNQNLDQMFIRLEEESIKRSASKKEKLRSCSIANNRFWLLGLVGVPCSNEDNRFRLVWLINFFNRPKKPG